MTKSQTGIPHVGTYGFPLTITLDLEEGSTLAGATAVLLEITGPEVKREDALQRPLELAAITDAENAVIVYTIQSGDFPVPGVHRLFVSVDFGAEQRLVASGRINIEG
jgi:hypothetical protein